MDTEVERVYGLLRADVSKDELEALFGPLDDELRACGESTRKAA